MPTRRGRRLDLDGPDTSTTRPGPPSRIPETSGRRRVVRVGNVAMAVDDGILAERGGKLASAAVFIPAGDTTLPLVLFFRVCHELR